MAGPPPPRAPEAGASSAPAPASLDFINTPEFRAAVAAAVAPLVAQMQAAPQPSGDVASILSSLAAKIAEVSDLNAPAYAPVRISPEVAERQRVAREKMLDLLTEVSEKKLFPTYKVCAKLFFNEQLIEPFEIGADKQARPKHIAWQGEPNDALQPADELAERIFLLFKETRAGYAVDKHGVGTLVAADKKYWVSSGLVIEGVGPSADKGFRAEYVPQSELARKSVIDPNAPELKILGTVAPPAQQAFSGAFQVPR